MGKYSASILMVLSVLPLSSSFADESLEVQLIQAQKEIIRLQDEVSDLKRKTLTFTSTDLYSKGCQALASFATLLKSESGATLSVSCDYDDLKSGTTKLMARGN